MNPGPTRVERERRKEYACSRFHAALVPDLFNLTFNLDGVIFMFEYEAANSFSGPSEAGGLGGL